MKNLTRRRFSMLILVAWGGFMTQLYQNCAPMQQFDVTEMASQELPPGHDTGSAGGDHPVENKTELPTRKLHVVPKSYVAALFREVFTSTKYPISTLEALIDKWVVYKGAQFGGSCNTYTSFSQRDCNGSAANVNLDSFVESNTVRESFRIQLCENIIGLDAGLNAGLEKAGLTTASAVNATTVTAVYGLFYRNAPPEELAVNTLLDLNSQLVASNVSAKERWRAILGQVCESPAWQLF